LRRVASTGGGTTLESLVSPNVICLSMTRDP
jgi:hypothetical protein